MILLSVGLLAFAVTDLLRGPLRQGAEQTSPSLSSRAVLAVAGGAVAVGALSASAGSPFGEVVLVTVAAVAVLGVWVAFDYEPLSGSPLLPLAWVGATLVMAAAISSLGDPIEGPLRDWYSGLDFAFVSATSVDQFVLGCSALLFAIASCNRIVMLVLELAATSLKEDDSRLKGGRFLGPMERIIVGAVILGGDPAAAAIVIAAKGLLRFPEIQKGPGPAEGNEAGRLSPDANTEYFLIGTLSSLLLASALALLIVSG